MSIQHKESLFSKLCLYRFLEFSAKEALIMQIRYQPLGEKAILFFIALHNVEQITLWYFCSKDTLIEYGEGFLMQLLEFCEALLFPQFTEFGSIFMVVLTFLLAISSILYFIIDFLKFWLKFRSFSQSNIYLKYHDNKSEWHKSLGLVQYYYNNLLVVALLLPLLNYSLNFLMTPLDSGRSLLTHYNIYVILAYFNLSYLIVYALIVHLLNYQTVTLQIKNFQSLKESFNSFIYFTFIVTLIFIKFLGISSSEKLVLSSMAFFGLNLIKLYNVFQLNFHEQPSKFLILISCFSLTLCAASLVLQPHKRVLEAIVMCISALLSLLMQRIFDENLVISTFSDSSKLQYWISQSIQPQLRGSQRLRYKVHRFILVNHHKKTCMKSTCFCRTNSKDTLQVEYLKNLGQLYQQLINHIEDTTVKFTHIVHYTYLLHVLGFNTQALRQVGFLSNQQTRTYSLSSIHRQPSSSSQQTVKHEENQDKFVQRHIKGMSLTSFQKLKIQVIQDLIQQDMNKYVQFTETTAADNLVDAVKLFLDQEQRQKYQISEILSIIAKKRDFLIRLSTENQFQTPSELFFKSKRLVQQMDHFYHGLSRQYQAFPSKKLQSILAFFVGELQGNYQKAHNISTIVRVNDEQLFNLQKKMAMSLFSSRTHYIKFELDTDFSLKILDKSSNCHRFFEYKQQEFEQIKTLNVLLPKDFHTIHQLMVAQFLDTGVSKFFRNMNLNFALMKSKYITTLDFFYEISGDISSNLQVTAFFSESDFSDEAIIVLNNKLQVSAINKALLKHLRFSHSLQDRIDPYLLLNRVNVATLLPDFPYISSKLRRTVGDQFTESLNSELNGLNLHGQWFRFLREEYIKECIETFQTTFNWQGEDYFNNYSAQITVRRTEVFEYQYYIIRLEHIKLQGSIKSNSKSIVGKEFDVISIEVSQEAGLNYPNQILSIERQLNYENDGSSYENHFGIKMVSISQINKKIQGTKDLFIENSYIGILSPKDSQSALMNDKKQQQHFFKSSIKDLSESVSKNENSSIQLNLARQLLEVDVNEEDRKKIEIQFARQTEAKKMAEQEAELDEVGSQVSSILGFKRSKYFRKYELYDNFQESRKISPQLYRMLLVFSLGLFLIFILCILSLSNSSSDIQRFLVEIDLISLKSQILGPLYKFIICSYQFTNYKINQFFFGEPLEKVISLMQFTIDERLSSYNLLTSNFQSQLENPYIQQFFENEFVTLNFQFALSELEQREISLLESVLLMIENSYLFTRDDPYGPIYEGNERQVTFFIANMLAMTDQFNELTQNIQDYTIERTYYVGSKWLYIFIPLMILFALLQVFVFLYYRSFRNFYNFSIQLLQNVTIPQVQSELTRLKVIHELINRDQTTVFRYIFDIELKDAYILQMQDKEQLKDLTKGQGKSKNLKRASLSNLRPVLIILVFTLIGIAYGIGTLVLVRIFLVDYRPSIHYYRTLTDTSIAISGVYTFRETIYFQSMYQSFFYFTSQDVEIIRTYFDTDLRTIKTFQQDLLNFDSGQQIKSETYSTQLNKIIQTNMCDFLDEKDRESALLYCRSIYDGVMLNGMAPTLIYTTSKLENEKQVNNFTLRDQNPMQEVELSMITYTILQKLQDYYKDSLIQITSQLIRQIQLIAGIGISYLMLFIVVLNTLVLAYFKSEFQIVRKFIQLAPQQLLFVDSSFERELRTFGVQKNLI